MSSDQDLVVRQLAGANRIIEQQASFIKRVMAQQGDTGFAGDLRKPS